MIQLVDKEYKSYYNHIPYVQELEDKLYILNREIENTKKKWNQAFRYKKCLRLEIHYLEDLFSE